MSLPMPVSFSAIPAINLAALRGRR